MLYVKNPAGYEFRWYDGSDFIEVFHKLANFPGEPIEAVYAGGMKRSESDLRRYANETPDYGRAYNA
jgi:hypothetical protein